jgi:FkbM family methyltransferase
MIKPTIKSVAKLLGYEIHKIPPLGRGFFRDSPRDPFLHQLMFLKGHHVSTILDVGSNIGNTVATYRSLFPQAMIYSFEPFSETFEIINQRFEQDRLVKPVQMAIADKPGTRKFYVRGRNDSNSLLPSAKYGQRYEHIEGATINKIIDVPVTTIDEFCSDESISEIQILKIDIEGSELMALRGATEKLSGHLIGLIYSEATFIPHNQDEPLFYEVCEFLLSYDYTLYDIYHTIRARNGQLRRADVIFVSPQIRRVIDSIDPMP